MDKSVDEGLLKKEGLVKHIIGEIAVSSEPFRTIRKWRSLFRISQKGLSGRLGVTSSVISDYESGRRKSPGINFLRKYVEALISIDEEKGGEMLAGFLHAGEGSAVSPAIADIREFEKGIDVRVFCGRIGAVSLVSAASGSGKIYGYTVIDSVKAITELPFSELIKLYGITTQRALVFTNITSGKGPMIAIKVANLRPALVVLHNIPADSVSAVAKDIAAAEGIPIAVCNGPGLEELIEKLKGVS
jgi:putative transcriptional regulator